jgi:hypothetical protein
MRLVLALQSGEAKKISRRLHQEIGSFGKRAEVIKVERCENKELFATLHIGRGRVYDTRGRDDCKERWLWHGTDALDSIINHHERIQHVSVRTSLNADGFGNNCAPDAKLSDFFIQDARGGHAGAKKLSLARACCGKIADKIHLQQSIPSGTGRYMCLKSRQPLSIVQVGP